MHECICTALVTNKTTSNITAELHHGWKVFPSYWNLLWMNEHQSPTAGCNLLLLLQYTEWLFLSIICFILCRKLAHISKHTLGSGWICCPVENRLMAVIPYCGFCTQTHLFVCLQSLVRDFLMVPPPHWTSTTQEGQGSVCVSRWILFSCHERVNP